MSVAEARVPLRALRRDFLAVFEGLYSKADLVWVSVGRRRFLLVNGADQVREVMIERAEELVKPPSQTIEIGPPAAVVPGDGFPVPLFRRALAKGLGAERIGDMLDAVAAAAATETADWRDGSRPPLMPRLRRIAIRSVCRASFASRLADDEIAKVEGVMRWFDRKPRVTSPATRRWRRFTRHGMSEKRVMEQLASVAGSLIENADLSRPTEMSAVVRDLPAFAPSLTLEDRKDVVGELLLGATGPLTQTAGWTLLRFATEADAAEALRREWADVLAPGEPVNRASLGGLRYTDAFVREVTRLHGTNVRIVRSAVVDTAVGREPIPARTRVILNVNGLHRDPRLYDEPERFLPERWVDGRPSAHKFAYVAFGAGGRRCLGETMAMVALVALLPALTRTWDLAFADYRSSRTGRRQLAENTQVELSIRR